MKYIFSSADFLLPLQWDVILLLHITREFYSIKLICTNLYALFSRVKKAYTANQNGVQLFHVCNYNQSTMAKMRFHANHSACISCKSCKSFLVIELN